MVSPWKLDERALRRWVTVAANVVLPEPGMPETAIRRRSLGGIVWSFAGPRSSQPIYLPGPPSYSLGSQRRWSAEKLKRDLGRSRRGDCRVTSNGCLSVR